MPYQNLSDITEGNDQIEAEYIPRFSSVLNNIENNS